MPYRVLIIVKDQWWSDEKKFPSFPAARAHQNALAEKWNDCETAILAPDGRVLNFREAANWLRETAEMRREEKSA